MKIVNGNGKIVEGQYIANRQDQLETMALIKVMEQRVKSIIAKKIGKMDKLKPTRYWALLQDATAYLFTPKISVNGPNFLTYKQAAVFVSTGHNSSGYSNEVAKRFFTISFELTGNRRYKHQKNWTEGATVLKKYILADSMEDAIKEFENWIQNDYDKFFAIRLLQNKTWQECR
jgi:hypothetical protein